MQIEFPCQNCGARITIRHLSPGETAQCKKCGAKNTVPEESVAQETAIEDRQDNIRVPISQNITNNTTELRSEKTATFLLILFCLLILTEIVSMVIMYDLHDYLGNPLQSGNYRIFIILGLILVIALPITMIVFFIWLFRVHEELAAFYPGYPVKPYQSVIRLLVPIYNIWGFWNVFMNIIRHFRGDHERIKILAQRLYLPFMAVFVLNIAGHLLLFKYFFPADKLSYAGLFSWEDLLNILLAAIQFISTLAVFLLIRKALKIKLETSKEV